MKETADGLGVGLCTFSISSRINFYIVLLLKRSNKKNFPELHQPDSEYRRLRLRRLLDLRDASFLKITEMMTNVSKSMQTITKHSIRPSMQKWDLLL